MTAPTLASERLLMRPWRAGDRVPFAALNADPRVMATIGNVLTREESDAFADRIAGHVDTQGWGLWALEIPGKAEFIGYAGLSRPAPINSQSDPGRLAVRVALECRK